MLLEKPIFRGVVDIVGIEDVLQFDELIQTAIRHLRYPPRRLVMDEYDIKGTIESRRPFYLRSSAFSAQN